MIPNDGRRLLAAAALLIGAAAGFWDFEVGRHAQVDLSATWAAGRLESAGADPYGGVTLVDGQPFPRTHFIYGPLAATLFRPLGALDFGTARKVWYAAQIACLSGMLLLGLGSLSRSLAVTAVVVVTSPLLFYPIYAHLERGQADLIVGLMAFGSLVLWERGVSRTAGALLICAAVVKLPACVLLIAPIAARDRRFVEGSATAIGLVAILALAIEGPARIERYARVILPHVDRHGTLPPEIASGPTPEPPGDGDSGRIADFGHASNGSVTRLVRRHWGQEAGTATAATGLALTLAAALFAVGPDARSLSWLAATAAMLAFQPMTWLMGCVHLIPLALRAAQVRRFAGKEAAFAVAGSLGLICMGEPIAHFLPRRFGHRTALGVLAVWSVLVWALAASRRRQAAMEASSPPA